MKSKMFWINARDAVRGLVVSVLTSGMTTLYAVLNTGAMPDKSSLKTVALSGAAAGVAYILKNFLTNSNDEFLKPEQK